MRKAQCVRTGLALVTLVCFLGMTTACYGPFNLTHTLYKWNGSVKGGQELSAKWAQELVFLALVLFPIYEFSLLLDALVFNSIQFWTGDNPIKVSHGENGQIRLVRAGETTITLTPSQDGNSARISYSRAGQVFKTAEIVGSQDGYDLVEEGGRRVYSAEVTGDGGLKLVNNDCIVIRDFSAVQVAHAASELAATEAIAE